MVTKTYFLHPISKIFYELQNVRVYLDRKDLGLGTLFLSERTLCWHKRGNNENVGFSLIYPNVSLHAISKDRSIYPTECVYVMIDDHITVPGASPPYQENGESSDEDSTATSELLLIPESTEEIQRIYKTICLCQELNPDPMDEDDDDDEDEDGDLSEDNDDNLYEDAEGEMQEGEYEIIERGGGDADIDDLTRRIQANSVNVQINYRNGIQDDDDFQDAD